jgi:hypothetical protein
MIDKNHVYIIPTTEKEFLIEREYRINILKNCGIYMIQNLINNYLYIGSSINRKEN